MKKRATISAMGSYLPVGKITNADLEKNVETDDEWIRTRTGITERRRIAVDENCSDIGAKACLELLNNASLDATEIDLLICTSLSHDQLCPSTASLIQKKVGLKNAAAFDLTSACAGFSFSLTTAASFIESGHYKNVVVVGSEAISRLINWSDRNTCILFGDGAGAVLVQPADEPYGILGSYLATDGKKSDAIEIKAGGSAIPASHETVDNGMHFLQMKGQEVFKFAVRVIPKAINSVLEKSDLKIEDVDLIIPHQANKRIIEAAARQLDMPIEKFFTNLELLGNTSTASVPLALEQSVKEKKLKKGDIVVTVGFGGGLSWGANVLRWSIEG